jgi:restriction system protein
MGRKTSSFADDVISLVARMPWWAGVLLAAASFVVLHHYAATPVVAAVVEAGKPLPIASTFFSGATHGLATLGQYLLPLLCLAGALVSALKRSQSQQLVARATELKDASAVDGMTWQEFERLVAQAFRLRGYRVTETGGDRPDGGVDAVLTKGTEKFLVQCKHWRAQRVGVDVVRELYGVMAAKGATGGFVVTSGHFSGEAEDFAEGRNIELINGMGLKRLLQEAQAPGDLSAAEAQRHTARSNTPKCPRCDGPMVKRATKRGASTGEEFWGCAGFPKCRGTRPA